MCVAKTLARWEVTCRDVLRALDQAKQGLSTQRFAALAAFNEVLFWKQEADGRLLRGELSLEETVVRTEPYST